MSQTHGRPDHGMPTNTPPGTPRWVKVFGIIAVVVVLLFIMMMLIGGGQHGPGRHLPSGSAGANLAITYVPHSNTLKGLPTFW